MSISGGSRVQRQVKGTVLSSTEPAQYRRDVSIFLDVSAEGPLATLSPKNDAHILPEDFTIYVLK